MKDSQKRLLGIVVGVGLVLVGGLAYFRHAGAGSPKAPAQAELERVATPGNGQAVVDAGPSVERPPIAPVPVVAGDAAVAVVPQGTEGASVVDEALIKELKSATIRPRDFQARIKGMALRGDQAAVDTLIALSDERYEELAVVEALGSVYRQEQRGRVGEHLRGKIIDSPLPVLMVALKSYARVMRDDGIPVMKESIRNQWRRPDGFGEMACSAAVEGLGSILTPAAQAALIAELERVTEPGWLPDYGSVVVAALGKRNTPEASEALRRYADALERKQPPLTDPPGRRYYEEKIDEARRAAEGRTLDGTGRTNGSRE